MREPQADKVRKVVPTEAEVAAFNGRVRDRYPTWDRLHALLELKALAGCRTLDTALEAIPPAMLQEVEGQVAGAIVIPAVLGLLRGGGRADAEAGRPAAGRVGRPE